MLKLRLSKWPHLCRYDTVLTVPIQQPDDGFVDPEMRIVNKPV